jgi:4'-phosphopantetheinyl transferase
LKLIEVKDINAVKDLPDPRQLFFVLIVDITKTIEPKNFLLTHDEVAKAKAFRKSIDTKNYQYRHHLLNTLITTNLNIPLDQVKFTFNKWKKPFLESNPFYFNLSHSNNVFVLAFAPFEIGVDVECIRDTTTFDLVREQHFHPDEKNQVSEANKDISFFKTWTRKEALLKIIGTGLVSNLSSIDTSSEVVDQITLQTVEMNNCMISFALKESNWLTT